MLIKRPARERGHFNHGWLDTWHTFSFADYMDPAHMQFRALRVINEDRIAGNAGFPTHPHRDMEIVTYLLAGAIGHKDSMGNGSIIRPGEIQRMTAGTGITHSEINASPEETHLLQIWLLPSERGLTPGYEQLAIPPAEMAGRFRLLAAPEGGAGAVTIHTNARLYATRLDAGESATQPIAPGRYGWLQVARGSLEANGMNLQQGDGLALSEIEELAVTADDPTELLFFDLE